MKYLQQGYRDYLRDYYDNNEGDFEGFTPADPNLGIKPTSEMESGYSYNADTATQSPALAADLAIHNAYSQPLQTDAATGDAYPRIDYGSNNPFSMAANMGQYMADQATLLVQNTVPSYEGTPTEAPSTDTASPEKPAAGRPGFDNPELLQTRGQKRIDRAQAVLDDPASAKEARLKAKLQKHRGRDMLRGGQLAEAFRDTTTRRDEKIEAGKNVSRQSDRLDRKFSRALRRFGAETANEMAGTYGDNRYSKGNQDLTDEKKAKLTEKLQQRMAARDTARAKAGGKKYDDIKGTGEKAEKRKAAALRARQYSGKISRQLGRASRKYGADAASEIAQSLGLGKYRG